jgi:hypothetical protein
MKRFVLAFLLILAACAPATPLPAATPAPTCTPGPAFTVRVHPDGPLYVGDLVSFEVFAPSGMDTAETSVQISANGQALASAEFESFGIGARSQATFYWAWDTSGLEAGAHTLDFTLPPSGPSWQETYILRPAAEVPYPEPTARWETLTTDCCVIGYITGSEAERDLETLADMADKQADKVEAIMQAEFNAPVELVFFPRVLGHGGFASDAIYISYLDQNYSGGDLEQVIHHEMVHILDHQLGGGRTSILVEGLATWLSGGHFKPEPIYPRAAALLQLDWYIPLQKLADDFYPSQHEIGYLEAAALTGYLIDTYGWETFNLVHRGSNEGEVSPSKALDAAFRQYLGRSFDEIETDFVEFLRTQTVKSTHVIDVRLTVAYYDTLRAYQQALDPSAHYLTAWLPSGAVMRERGIVADFLRRPRAPINERIEGILVQTNQALLTGDYPAVEQNLRTAQTFLEIWTSLLR